VQRSPTHSAIDTDTLKYRPLAYALAPSKIGLKKLPSNSTDPREKLFQFDQYFNDYRNVKIAGRKERLEKYYQCTKPCPKSIINFIINKLSNEYPKDFILSESHSQIELKCLLSEESLIFDKDFKLLQDKSTTHLNYLDSFDALAMQCQEDLVVYQKNDSVDAATGIHLFHPNGWSAEEQIGRCFTAIHTPILDYKKLLPNADKIVEAIINNPNTMARQGATNYRLCPKLNQHPEYYIKEVKFKKFDPTKPELYIRFERQTVTGFPKERSFLFTVRNYVTEISEECLSPDEINELQAIFSQNNKHIERLPFLQHNQEAILEWLFSLNSDKN